jgi:hypothetical protein
VEVLEAVAREYVWFDPKVEIVYLPTDDGPRDVTEAVDVLREPSPPLVIHDAVNYTLPPELRPLVSVRITLAGEMVLQGR